MPGQEQSRSLNSTWAHKTNVSKRGGREEKAKKERNDLIQPLVSQMKSLLSIEGMTAQGHICTDRQPKTPSSYSSSFLHPTMRSAPCSPDLPGLLRPWRKPVCPVPHACAPPRANATCSKGQGREAEMRCVCSLASSLVSFTLEHMNTRLLQSQGSWGRDGQDLIGSTAPSHTCPVVSPCTGKARPCCSFQRLGSDPGSLLLSVNSVSPFLAHHSLQPANAPCSPHIKKPSP